MYINTYIIIQKNQVIYIFFIFYVYLFILFYFQISISSCYKKCQHIWMSIVGPISYIKGWKEEHV